MYLCELWGFCKRAGFRFVEVDGWVRCSFVDGEYFEYHDMMERDERQQLARRCAVGGNI